MQRSDGITRMAGTAIMCTGPGGLNQSLTVNYVRRTNRDDLWSIVNRTNERWQLHGERNVSGKLNFDSSSLAISKNFSIAKAASTTVVTITGGPFTLHRRGHYTGYGGRDGDGQFESHPGA